MASQARPRSAKRTVSYHHFPKTVTSFLNKQLRPYSGRVIEPKRQIQDTPLPQVKRKPAPQRGIDIVYMMDQQQRRKYRDIMRERSIGVPPSPPDGSCDNPPLSKPTTLVGSVGETPASDTSLVTSVSISTKTTENEVEDHRHIESEPNKLHCLNKTPEQHAHPTGQTGATNMF